MTTASGWRKSSYSGQESACVELWRKSSHSSQESNCVEIAESLDAVRDSKNTAGPALRVDLGPLLAEIKAGRLTR